MHPALLLLAILELPGGLRVQLPPDTCVVIDRLSDAELHRGEDKTPLLTISKGYDELPGIEAGDYCYAVYPDTQLIARTADTGIKRPHTDTPCSYTPLLRFFHNSGGVAPLITTIEIWSDGEISGDYHGFLTAAELSEIRQIVMTIRDGVPPAVRDTLAKIDPILAAHFGSYRHQMRIREVAPEREVFPKSP